MISLYMKKARERTRRPQYTWPMVIINKKPLIIMAVVIDLVFKLLILLLKSVAAWSAPALL